MSELHKCFKGQESSFLNELYYRSTFNEEKFKILTKEIISEIEKGEMVCDEDFITRLFFLFSKLNQALISHFDVEDLYEIENASKSLRVYTERLSFLVERYLDKDFKRILNYEDEMGKFID